MRPAPAVGPDSSSRVTAALRALSAPAARRSTTPVAGPTPGPGHPHGHPGCGSDTKLYVFPADCRV